ncbi:DUF2256 domain-containing protein [Bordetella avium]|uniref:DUF2256 domain-containing protein n=1 Tax=Bordetella avium TaxID=521 RepID=UPI0035BE1DD3
MAAGSRIPAVSAPAPAMAAAAAAMSPPRGHRGNKQYLPSKPCAHCQRPMTWRRRWARCWEQVLYCCEACRRAGPAKVRS